MPAAASFGADEVDAVERVIIVAAVDDETCLPFDDDEDDFADVAFSDFNFRDELERRKAPNSKFIDFLRMDRCFLL